MTCIYTLVQGSCAPFQDRIDVGFGHEQRGHISLYPPAMIEWCGKTADACSQQEA